MRDFFDDINSIDGMNERDPMDDFMSRVEREFFGGNSGLFGTFQGGGFPHHHMQSSAAHHHGFDDEFESVQPSRRINQNR